MYTLTVYSAILGPTITYMELAIRATKRLLFFVDKVLSKILTLTESTMMSSDEVWKTRWTAFVHPYQQLLTEKIQDSIIFNIA